MHCATRRGTGVGFHARRLVIRDRFLTVRVVRMASVLAYHRALLDFNMLYFSEMLIPMQDIWLYLHFWPVNWHSLLHTGKRRGRVSTLSVFSEKVQETEAPEEAPKESEEQPKEEAQTPEMFVEQSLSQGCRWAWNQRGRWLFRIFGHLKGWSLESWNPVEGFGAHVGTCNGEVANSLT